MGSVVQLSDACRVTDTLKACPRFAQGQVTAIREKIIRDGEKKSGFMKEKFPSEQNSDSKWRLTAATVRVPFRVVFVPRQLFVALSDTRFLRKLGLFVFSPVNFE